MEARTPQETIAAFRRIGKRLMAAAERRDLREAKQIVAYGAQVRGTPPVEEYEPGVRYRITMIGSTFDWRQDARGWAAVKQQARGWMSAEIRVVEGVYEKDLEFVDEAKTLFGRSHLFLMDNGERAMVNDGDPLLIERVPLQ